MHGLHNVKIPDEVCGHGERPPRILNLGLYRNELQASSGEQLHCIAGYGSNNRSSCVGEQRNLLHLPGIENR